MIVKLEDKKMQEISGNTTTKMSAIKENVEKGLTNKTTRKEDKNREFVLDQEDEIKVKTEPKNLTGKYLRRKTSKKIDAVNKK